MDQPSFQSVLTSATVPAISTAFLNNIDSSSSAGLDASSSIVPGLNMGLTKLREKPQGGYASALSPDSMALSSSANSMVAIVTPSALPSRNPFGKISVNKSVSPIIINSLCPKPFLSNSLLNHIHRVKGFNINNNLVLDYINNIMVNKVSNGNLLISNKYNSIFVEDYNIDNANIIIILLITKLVLIILILLRIIILTKLVLIIIIL